MKSQGEIEAAVCEGVSRFQQEFIGRGPKDIHCHLLGSLVVVRLQGVLTPAERQLVMPRKAHNGNGNGHAAVDGNGHHVANGADHAGNGVATAEAHLPDDGNGRALLKQVRTHVVTNGRNRLEQLVEGAVGVRLVSVHHDISTVTGEELLVFTLSEAPACRQRKKD
jgi:uncharacterized protein YbcI